MKKIIIINIILILCLIQTQCCFFQSKPNNKDIILSIKADKNTIRFSDTLCIAVKIINNSQEKIALLLDTTDIDKDQESFLGIILIGPDSMIYTFDRNNNIFINPNIINNFTYTILEGNQTIQYVMNFPICLLRNWSEKENLSKSKKDLDIDINGNYYGNYIVKLIYKDKMQIHCDAIDSLESNELIINYIRE
jgi:hypothetical protein